MTEQIKEEILNLFCEPGKWDGLKIECIALMYRLDAAKVKEIIESDERVAAEELRKWRYHLIFMEEVFGINGIAKKFGISKEQVTRIMKEEGL